MSTNDAAEPAAALDLSTPVRPAAEHPTSGAKPARRAVVAEDEALIRMDVVETLTEAGFEVSTCQPEPACITVAAAASAAEAASTRLWAAVTAWRLPSTSTAETAWSAVSAS